MNKKEILEKVQVVYEFLSEDLQALQTRYSESKSSQDKVQISKFSDAFKKLEALRGVLERELSA